MADNVKSFYFGPFQTNQYHEKEKQSILLCTWHLSVIKIPSILHRN